MSGLAFPAPQGEKASKPSIPSPAKLFRFETIAPGSLILLRGGYFAIDLNHLVIRGLPADAFAFTSM